MAEGPNPLSLSAIHGIRDMLPSMAAKKKHLLHRLMKKVLIHSRQTIEIWYMLPNTQRFADGNIWLPMDRSLQYCLTGNVPQLCEWYFVYIAVG
jgi:hypothetical protein